jgi:hypothetical protein
VKFWSAARDRRFGILFFAWVGTKNKNTKAAIHRRTPKAAELALRESTKLLG